jgi:hypothetical protein
MHMSIGFEVGPDTPIRLEDMPLPMLRAFAVAIDLRNRLGKRQEPNPYADMMDARAAAAQVAEDDPEPSPAEGTIYVIGYGGWVKIGFTIGPVERRMAALQTGCPEPLILYGQLTGTVALERELHKRFAVHSCQGEWFRLRGRLKRWIAEGCPP